MGSSGDAAVGALSPEDDFGFVHLVAGGVRRFEAGCVSGRAIGIDHATTGTADEVMVVVAGLHLETGGGTGGLDSPEEAAIYQCGQSVVDGLMRD